VKILQGLVPKFTYANVVATIALVVAIGGGSVAVAASIKKDSVGSKQIKANAIKTAELASGAVTGEKIGPGAVTTGALADNSVTGAKLDESGLGAVPEATTALNVLSAVVKSDGSLTQATQANTTVVKAGTGTYIVDYGRAVTGCTSTATIGNVSPPNPPTVPPAPPPVIPEPGFIGSSNVEGNVEAIKVVTRSPNIPFNFEDHAFEVVTVC
jgi:hypothetical protein